MAKAHVLTRVMPGAISVLSDTALSYVDSVNLVKRTFSVNDD